MATLAFPTSATAPSLVQRPTTRPPAKPGKITAIHRFALATVILNPSAAIQPPALLPETIPQQCCFNNFRCQNLLRWKIDEGFFCNKHAENFWLRGHFVQDHKVARVYSDGEIGGDLD